MATFTEMKNQAGKRILVNIDLVFCFVEGDSGEAIAMSEVGAPIHTGLKYDDVVSNLMTPESPPT